VPTRRAIQLLKSVSTDLIARSRRLNFGLTKFQNDHRRQHRRQLRSSYTSLLAQIAGLTANT